MAGCPAPETSDFAVLGRMPCSVLVCVSATRRQMRRRASVVLGRVVPRRDRRSARRRCGCHRAPHLRVRGQFQRRLSRHPPGATAHPGVWATSFASHRWRCSARVARCSSTRPVAVATTTVSRYGYLAPRTRAHGDPPLSRRARAALLRRWRGGVRGRLVTNCTGTSPATAGTCRSGARRRACGCPRACLGSGEFARLYRRVQAATPRARRSDSPSSRANCSFRRTSVLEPGHGMTIVVGWPAGAVHRPTARSTTRPTCYGTTGRSGFRYSSCSC